MRNLALAFVIFFVTGCGSIRTNITEDIVETPVYRENRVFYFQTETSAESPVDNRRYSSLGPPYALVPNGARSIRNGEPVAIIVNGAYVPNTLTQPDQYAKFCEIGASRKTRDIAVLANIATEVDSDDEFIAVWYQRDVPADETLSFQDLVVYSDDIWDNRAPPYFRLRIVDVSNERNTATEEMLKQVGASGGTISSLAGSPALGFAFNFATKAADLILGNTCNRTLLDYSFHVFSSAQISAAGGMPLGQFQTGGIILVGLPYDSESLVETRGSRNFYWENNFKFDHRLRRVQLASTGQTVNTPYISATVMRADLFVPKVVARRSQRITQVLTDRSAARENLSELITDVNSLQAALSAYKLVENFNVLPSKQAFNRFVEDVAEQNISGAEETWLLSVMRNVTGLSFSSVNGYKDWFTRCGEHVEFDRELRRFAVKDKKNDKGEPCD